MSKVRNVWNDPVGSKLIAELIKGTIIFLWPFIAIPIYTGIKSIITRMTFVATLVQTWNSVKSFFITDFTVNAYSIFLIFLLYVVISYSIKKMIRRTVSYKIKSYNQDRIWNADIKWKWIKEDGKWGIEYGNYNLACPLCHHDLAFEVSQGHHYLNCRNLNCSFKSLIYHYEPPSNVIILMDMNTHYFHTALESTVKSKLRGRGISV